MIKLSKKACNCATVKSLDYNTVLDRTYKRALRQTSLSPKATFSAPRPDVCPSIPPIEENLVKCTRLWLELFLVEYPLLSHAHQYSIFLDEKIESRLQEHSTNLHAPNCMELQLETCRFEQIDSRICLLHQRMDHLDLFLKGMLWKTMFIFRMIALSMPNPGTMFALAKSSGITSGISSWITLRFCPCIQPRNALLIKGTSHQFIHAQVVMRMQTSTVSQIMSCVYSSYQHFHQCQSFLLLGNSVGIP